MQLRISILFHIILPLLVISCDKPVKNPAKSDLSMEEAMLSLTSDSSDTRFERNRPNSIKLDSNRWRSKKTDLRSIFTNDTEIRKFFFAAKEESRMLKIAVPPIKRRHFEGSLILEADGIQTKASIYSDIENPEIFVMDFLGLSVFYDPKQLILSFLRKQKEEPSSQP